MNYLAQIQGKLKAPKSQRNTFGNYNYRSCEDILEALKPLIAPDGYYISLSDEVVLVGSRIYVKATATLTNGEQVFTSTAYAREEETKKGMDGSQITGAASSYARKYALNGLFAIDDAKDSDATNTHEKEAKTLPKLAKGTKQFTDCVTALKSGYKIADIRGKYDVSPEVEAALNAEVAK